MPLPALATTENVLLVSCSVVIAAVLFAQIKFDRYTNEVEQQIMDIEKTAENMLQSKSKDLEKMASELHQLRRSGLDFYPLQKELEDTVKLQEKHHNKIVELRSQAALKRLENRCLGNKHGKVCWHEELPECHLDLAYNGTKTETRLGFTCSSWQAHLPPFLKMHMSGSTCRNPNGQPGPWCYFSNNLWSDAWHWWKGSSNQHYQLWDFCFEPCQMSEECLNEHSSGKKCWRSDWPRCRLLGSFTGGASQSIDGKNCLDWNRVNSTLYDTYLEDKCHMMNVDYKNATVKAESPWCYTDKGNLDHTEPCFVECESEGTDPVLINDDFLNKIDLW